MRSVNKTSTMYTLEYICMNIFLCICVYDFILGGIFVSFLEYFNSSN